MMKTNRRGFTQAFAGGGLALAAGLSQGTAATAKGNRIKKIEVLPTAVEFRSAFNIGVGKVGGKGLPGKHVFVRAETADGLVGWGATNTVPNCSTRSRSKWISASGRR